MPFGTISKSKKENNPRNYSGGFLLPSGRRRLCSGVFVYSSSDLITRHGFPAANTPAGMSRVTTLPAPMTLSEPMVTPPITRTPAPNHTLSPTVIGLKICQPSRRFFGSMAWVTVEKVQSGPIRTASPKVTSPPSRILQL